MRAIAQPSDINVETEDAGVVAGTWHELSEAAASVRLGAHRIEVPAGRQASPLHAEDEEIFYVLGGNGLSVQEDGCFAIGAGDVVYYGAYAPAHTVVAGPDGIDLIAFGTSDGLHGSVRFPRLGRVKVHDYLLAGDSTHQWDLENELGVIAVPDEPDPRPATIVNVSELDPVRFSRDPAQASAWFFGRHLGARGIALNRSDIAPGKEAAPPHCHSHEEELFYVLGGDGVLLLGAGEEEHAVSEGCVVGRPAGSGVAHAFRAGEHGLSLLMFSDKHPGDTCFYPRSQTITMRGLGVTFRPEIVPWGGG